MTPSSRAGVGDLNNDGALDVAAMCWWDGGIVTVLINTATVWHSPLGMTAGPVDAIQLYFSNEMNPDSFSVQEDIVSFTGPQEPLTVDGYAWLDTRTLEITFAPQSTAGIYEMVIGPQVLDAMGNPMDFDQDSVAGEVPPLESIRLSFDRPMDQTAFSLAEDVVSFTGPQGPIVPTGYSWVNPRTLEVTFDRQWTMGTYEMVVGPQILELAGNALDQDRDLVPEEVPDDQYTASFLAAYSGTLMQDTTWTPEHGVVIVDRDLTVPSDVTLTIEAGTIVKTSGMIYVEGTLDINGTASDLGKGEHLVRYYGSSCCGWPRRWSMAWRWGRIRARKRARRGCCGSCSTRT